MPHEPRFIGVPANVGQWDMDGNRLESTPSVGVPNTNWKHQNVSTGASAAFERSHRLDRDAGRAERTSLEDHMY